MRPILTHAGLSLEYPYFLPVLVFLPVDSNVLIGFVLLLYIEVSESMMWKENKMCLNKCGMEMILKILLFEGDLQPSYHHI